MPVTNYHTLNGELLGETGPGGRRFYGKDALGSVVATYDQDGTLENTYRYKPYGGLLSKTGSAPDPSFMWTGSTGSRTTGASYAEQYNRARHYGSRQAGWTSVDPLWPDELAYAYSRLNPMTNADPSGRACAPSVKITLSNNKCTCTDCCRTWHPSSWLRGQCSYDHQSQMEFDSKKLNGCKKCKFYQWIKEGSQGWIRDTGEGWPYPMDCLLPHYCLTHDLPGERGTIYGCDNAHLRIAEFVSCLCCSNYAYCFSWGFTHACFGCGGAAAYCTLWGPKVLTTKAAKANCQLGGR
ncbi:MAG: hypothetical protein H3C58_03130 [Fimbriimonadaceae bacterium]|nr:hypothetical protein [Fimbriimonadaceae bacterium]